MPLCRAAAEGLGSSDGCAVRGGVAGGGDWILACGREAARFEKGPPIHLLEDVDAT